MNPNHPHYAGLGGGAPNLNLLDNMLMAAGFQVLLTAAWDETSLVSKIES